MAGTLHGDRAPIAHGRRMLRHGRAPKGADVVESDYDAEMGDMMWGLVLVSRFFLLAEGLSISSCSGLCSPSPPRYLNYVRGVGLSLYCS
jgi:hypothetical protein